MSSDNKKWRFCVVGNIKEQHTGADGEILYGTIAFSGGTKIYLDDRTWGLNCDKITVIGLNRYKKYAVESVQVDLIENIRIQRIFKPTVLEIMDYLEAVDGWKWRGRTAEDKRELKKFVESWRG